MIFNTKIIELIKGMTSDGENWSEIFKETPFYDGDQSIRKSGITFQFTNKEHEEYIKCSQDVMYFAENYCFIKIENGTISKIELRGYQKDYIFNLTDKNRLIVAKSRQIGISVIEAIYILWYSIFNADKTAMIVANLRSSAVEFLDKIKLIYNNLPFWLKTGIKNWNQTGIHFENGCKIKSSARSKTPAIGFQIHFLYITEFAHIPNDIIETYYRAVFPIISSILNSKIIISSTPNGMNLFQKLFTDAEEGKNDYFPIRMRYDLVPGRDDKWKEQTIKEIGGISAFEQEYELKFHDKINDRIHKIEDFSKNELLERIEKLEKAIQLILNKLNI